jgi:hypothetical protein|tara:strand:+ start:1812 stop:2000 length:189 start_codon:yes stop_codon:yes gene_type:complete
MFAVQPAIFANFDEHGADYASTIDDAYAIARDMGEDAMIWKLGTQKAMKWIRVSVDEVVTTA